MDMVGSDQNDHNHNIPASRTGADGQRSVTQLDGIRTYPPARSRLNDCKPAWNLPSISLRWPRSKTTAWAKN